VHDTFNMVYQRLYIYIYTIRYTIFGVLVCCIA